MARHYRVQLYWSGRSDADRVMSRQIFTFCASLGPIHERLEGWLFQDERTGVPAPADSDPACLEALHQKAVAWSTGAQQQLSYQPRFFLERAIDPPASFTVTCGIKPLGLGPVFTPNRLELLVRAGVGDERASRPVLEAILRSAVAAFQPDWGYVGTESIPQPPVAIFSDGTPVIGWMTYLRSAYPPVPRTLPTPAVVYPVGSLGTLIVAHPELFREGEPAHREAIDRVRNALKAAGTLVPHHALKGA